MFVVYVLVTYCFDPLLRSTLVKCIINMKIRYLLCNIWCCINIVYSYLIMHVCTVKLLIMDTFSQDTTITFEVDN